MLGNSALHSRERILPLISLRRFSIEFVAMNFRLARPLFFSTEWRMTTGSLGNLRNFHTINVDQNKWIVELIDLREWSLSRWESSIFPN